MTRLKWFCIGLAISGAAWLGCEAWAWVLKYFGGG
jgi:hypothetical protein